MALFATLKQWLGWLSRIGRRRRAAAGLEAPAKAGAPDRVHSAIKGTVGMVPVLGPPLQEIFINLWVPPLEKRRARWMEEITARLQELEQEDRVRIDELTRDETFVTLMLNAGSAAVRTHEKEKLSALRNAVLSSACSGSPDRNLELQFIALVDQLSGWHLRLLAVLSNPERYLSDGHPLLTEVLRTIIPVAEYYIPELTGQHDVVRQLYDDLFAKRLVATQGIAVRPGYPAIGKRTTQLGDDFLSYVMYEGDVVAAGSPL